MECYLSKWDKGSWEDGEYKSNFVGYKGFPIVSENQRATAEKWSKTMKAIDIPEELENCGVDGFDDRMNNKIFKVYYTTSIRGKETRIYFDMYVPEMLDLMRNGIIEHEIIKVPLVFIDRARLVMKDGKFYKEYMAKEAKKKALKETKVISAKSLKVGSCYSRTEDGDCFYYLGPIKGQGHAFIHTSSWGADNVFDNPSFYYDSIRITKSLGFKFEHGKKAVDENTIKKYFVKKRKLYEEDIESAKKINDERIKEAKERAQKTPWATNWEVYYSPYNIPKYENEFELLDTVEKLFETVDK